MSPRALAVLHASRPSFLILAPLCAGLGVALMLAQGRELSGLALTLVLVAALLGQAAVNWLNEYEDFRCGLDHLTRRTPFSGGSGALPATPEAARSVLMAGLAALVAVMAIGAYFLWLRGWPLLALGLLGVVLVVGYTHWITHMPWLCLAAPGLGFGPVMVLGGLLALGGRLAAPCGGPGAAAAAGAALGGPAVAAPVGRWWGPGTLAGCQCGGPAGEPGAAGAGPRYRLGLGLTPGWMIGIQAMVGGQQAFVG
ncbi:prenyltransferase [Halomonas salifodinae]|uniref:Prenyltransferase n=1 Tax=Halomonas salifodinae TaxID=438745 RepID=A0ABW2EQ44_9GAMM